MARREPKGNGKKIQKQQNRQKDDKKRQNGREKNTKTARDAQKTLKKDHQQDEKR